MHSLLIPRQKTRNPAYRHSLTGNRGQLSAEFQDLLLDVRGEPDQFHDLAHPFPCHTAKPGQVGVIPPSPRWIMSWKWMASASTCVIRGRRPLPDCGAASPFSACGRPLAYKRN